MAEPTWASCNYPGEASNGYVSCSRRDATQPAAARSQRDLSQAAARHGDASALGLITVLLLPILLTLLAETVASTYDFHHLGTGLRCLARDGGGQAGDQVLLGYVTVAP
jgi:hypothetical protein